MNEKAAFRKMQQKKNTAKYFKEELDLLVVTPAWQVEVRQ